MRKQSETHSRCRPCLEFLEHRSLLSGVYGFYQGPGHGMAPPPVSPFHTASPPLMNLAFWGGGSAFANGRTPAPGAAPADNGSSAQDDDANNTGAPAQPSNSGSSGPMAQSSFQTSIKVDSTSPSPSLPLSSAALPGVSVAPPLTRTSSAGPTGFRFEPLDAQQVAGVLGKDIGQESATGNNSSSNSSGNLNNAAAASLPNPVPPLPVADNAATSKLAILNDNGSQRSVPLSGAGSISFAMFGRHPGRRARHRISLLRRPDLAIVGNASGENELGEPGSADLLASAVPFDRAALDRALDEFLRPFEDLGSADFDARGPLRFVLYSLAIAGGLTAIELIRRRRERRDSTGGAGDPDSACFSSSDTLGFPELPGSWSSRLS